MNQKRHLGIAARSFCYALLSPVRALAQRYMTWYYLLIASEIIKWLFLFRLQCSFRKMKQVYFVQPCCTTYSLTLLDTIKITSHLFSFWDKQNWKLSQCMSEPIWSSARFFFFPLGFLTLPNLQWTPFNICFHRVLLNPPSLSDWVFCLIFGNREIMMLLGISVTRENDWWWELI